MATKIKLLQDLISPLEKLFKPLSVEQKEIFLSMLSDELYDDKLKAIFAEVVKSHKTTNFPTVAEILQVRNEIAARSPTLPVLKNFSEYGMTWGEAMRQAIRTDLAAQAVEEGWIYSYIVLWRGGKRSFDTRDIANLQHGFKKSCEAARKLNPSVRTDADLLEIWQGICSCRQEAVEEFKKLKKQGD